MKWDAIGPGDWRLLVEAGDDREGVLRQVGDLLDGLGLLEDCEPADGRDSIEIGDVVLVKISNEHDSWDTRGTLVRADDEGLTVRQHSDGRLCWVPTDRVVFVEDWASSK